MSRSILRWVRAERRCRSALLLIVWMSLRPAIPWRVALLHCSPPLHQPFAMVNPIVGTVNHHLNRAGEFSTGGMGNFRSALTIPGYQTRLPGCSLNPALAVTYEVRTADPAGAVYSARACRATLGGSAICYASDEPLTDRRAADVEFFLDVPSEDAGRYWLVLTEIGDDPFDKRLVFFELDRHILVKGVSRFIAVSVVRDDVVRVSSLIECRKGLKYLVDSNGTVSGAAADQPLRRRP